MQDVLLEIASVDALRARYKFIRSLRETESSIRVAINRRTPRGEVLAARGPFESPCRSRTMEIELLHFLAYLVDTHEPEYDAVPTREASHSKVHDALLKDGFDRLCA